MVRKRRTEEDGAGSPEAAKPEPEGDAERPQETAGTLEAVEDEIAVLRDELEQVNAKWLRALADLDNYKKRVERDRCRWADAAREEILLDLLDVVDNFERAVACGDGPEPPAADPYRKGVGLILEQLKSILAKNDVRPIDTCGAEFDPAFHEAVGHVESADHESNQIVEEERKGYTLGDRLLRCSRVVVAK